MMQIIVNGEAKSVENQRLADILAELDLGEAVVATAVNDNFVPQDQRMTLTLKEGDRLEVLAPMQGG
jgi:sulfur carrier protein